MDSTVALRGRNDGFPNNVAYVVTKIRMLLSIRMEISWYRIINN